MKYVKGFLVIAVIGAFLFGVVSCQLSIWRECRATNSFFYCARVLSK